MLYVYFLFKQLPFTPGRKRQNYKTTYDGVHNCWTVAGRSRQKDPQCAWSLTVWLVSHWAYTSTLCVLSVRNALKWVQKVSSPIASCRHVCTSYYYSILQLATWQYTHYTKLFHFSKCSQWIRLKHKGLPTLGFNDYWLKEVCSQQWRLKKEMLEIKCL